VGDKPAKRKKVTVRIIKEKHAGETTEPHKLLAEIRREEHAHLAEAKIGLAWRCGWRSDTDGHMKLGQCKKSSDLDREMYVGFDFVILLNEEAWPTLNAEQKAALIDHELCHAALSMDANGKPKFNDRDRLCCRVKKHDVEEFRCIVERHGLYTQDLAAIATAAINDAKRPLLAGAEKKSADTDEKPATNAWRKTEIDKVVTNVAMAQKLIDADLTTLGKLSDHMAENGQWWARNIKGVGEAAAEKISDMLAKFWSDHPEFTNEAAA
jgi:hypothetical protein